MLTYKGLYVLISALVLCDLRISFPFNSGIDILSAFGHGRRRGQASVSAHHRLKSRFNDGKLLRYIIEESLALFGVYEHCGYAVCSIKVMKFAFRVPEISDGNIAYAARRSVFAGITAHSADVILQVIKIVIAIIKGRNGLGLAVAGQLDG